MNHNPKFYILISIIVSGFIILLSDEKQVSLHILAIFILAVTSCVVVKFDFYHPMCWYPPFFFLYSCGYAILYALNITAQYGYSKKSLVYSWIALGTTILVFPSNRISYTPLKLERDNLFLIELVLNISLLLSVLAMYNMVNRGFLNKADIYDNSGFFLNFIFKIQYLVIIAFTYSLYIRLCKNEKISIVWVLKTFSVVIAFSMLTGERNYMFQIILLFIACLSIYGKLSKKLILMLIPVGIVLFPLSHVYKYYFLSGVKNVFKINNLIFTFLDGEFVSAGRNLQILISNNCEGLIGIKALTNDFVSTFFSTNFSIQLWFNNTFFAHSSIGYGFTLVGEGYVMGGLKGVFFLFLIIGLLVRILYLYSVKNPFYMIVYLYMIPLFIYTIRADFGNLISPMLKYAVLGGGIMYILGKIRVRYEAA
ncbi:MAG: oligosaccharide repeat unit polymerase [Dorea sp.]|nr:oligosaccharide repeat unit polymerase [Dorea sp.]